MTINRKKVVIIGGGITGLTAAYYLQKEIRENELPLEITLIEATHRLGGKMQTYKKDGYIIERGPDSFFKSNEYVHRLIEHLGLSNQLITNQNGEYFVVVNNKLYPIPKSDSLGSIKAIRPFAFSNLFSILGKLRAAGDLVIPKSSENIEDQPIGEFIRRRVGKEVLEHLVDPILTSIYAGDVDEMSLRATLPSYYEMERKYRSIIIGLSKQKEENKWLADIQVTQDSFQSLRGGLQTLADAIEEQLGNDIIISGTSVTSVEKLGQGYLLQLSSKQTIFADAIISAVPHSTLLNIFPNHPVFEPLKQIQSNTVANIALVFDEKAIKEDINGIGFAVARNSDYTITTATWTHKKWPHTAPEGKVLLRLYVGRPGDDSCVDLPDEDLINLVLSDLNKIMNITLKPEVYVISRWKDSMIQYNVGHLHLIKQLKENLAIELPGMFLCGASFDGRAVPECIKQGEKVVSDVLNYLNLKDN